MRGISAPGSGVCTRRGGGTGRIWPHSPRSGCKPPQRVHGCRPGGPHSPRPGCRPPQRVHGCRPGGPPRGRGRFPVSGGSSRQCGRPRVAAPGDVCTRFGGLHPPRGRGVRYAGHLCTRFGGLHPPRGRNRPDLAAQPPFRVQTPATGARLPSRRPAQPPFRVQTPATGARLPSRRPAQPPSRVQTPATGARLPSRRPAQPPSRVQTPATGARLPSRRPAQPPSRVQTPTPGARLPSRRPAQPPSRVQTPATGARLPSRRPHSSRPGCKPHAGCTVAAPGALLGAADTRTQAHRRSVPAQPRSHASPRNGTNTEAPPEAVRPRL